MPLKRPLVRSEIVRLLSVCNENFAKKKEFSCAHWHFWHYYSILDSRSYFWMIMNQPSRIDTISWFAWNENITLISYLDILIAYYRYWMVIICEEIKFFWMFWIMPIWIKKNVAKMCVQNLIWLNIYSPLQICKWIFDAKLFWNWVWSFELNDDFFTQ